jgi:hypothetical protein
MRLRLFLALGLLAVVVAACVAPPSGTGSGSGVQATNVWVRAAPSGNSAAFMILKNGGSAADRLVKAESDVSKAVEIHKTTMEGGVMKMAPVANIEVPAKGQAELKPGGFHVMFIDLNRELKPGEKIKLKLTFEQAGTQELMAEVRSAQ